MQRNIVQLISQVNSQKDQIANTLKNQDTIMSELNSLKAVSISTGTFNRVESATPNPGVQIVQTGRVKELASNKNKEPTNPRNKTTKTNPVQNTSKQPKRVSAQRGNTTTTTKSMDELIETHLPMWRKQHFYRRSEYKRHYMSKEKTKIIQDHISKKYIPRRFRPRETHTKAEYILEEKHSYATMKHESEKFNFHSENAQTNFNKADQEMLEGIDCISEISDTEKDKLKELWIEEVSAAVNKAHELCDYNLNYLRSLPKKEPYLGYQEPSVNSHRNNTLNKHNRNTYNSRNNQRNQTGFRQ